MNEFERLNLQNMREEGVDLSPFEGMVMDEIRSESRKSASAIVHALFDKHKGDAARVKEALRKDADLYDQLNLTEAINDTYQRIQAKRSRLKVTRWADDRAAGKKRPWLFADPS